MHWTDIFSDVNTKIMNDQFGLFGIFIMMMLFKGVFNSMAGGRVGRRGKSRHKGSKQSGKQQSAYSNGHKLVNSIRQDQFEVNRSGLCRQIQLCMADILQPTC